VLRNYLGTALIHAYEGRQAALATQLSGGRELTDRQAAAGPGPRGAAAAAGGGGGGGGVAALLDLDASLYLEAYSRGVLLEWVDALWSCFLEVSRRGTSHPAAYHAAAAEC
jgi:hypothetical protein